MPVFKRGDIWWYDFTVNGRRHRASTFSRTKAVAETLERKARDAALLGSVYDPTLEEAADLWFTARVVGKKDAKVTAHRVVIMLRHMGADTRLSEIGSRKITTALNARRVEPIRRGKHGKEIDRLPSNATVNRDMIDSTLRPILNYARDNLEAPVKPIEWAKLRLSEPRELVRWFTEAEIAAWEAAMPIWHRPILRFYLRYGVRLKEAFFGLDAIHGDDIYTRDRKNGPQVVTLLPEDAADIRARAGRARAAEIDTVWFKQEADGSLSAIHWRAFQSASAAALRKAGIKARPTHDARHHAGTVLLRRSKGNLAAVKALLGHEAIASTMRYAHTSTEDLRAAMANAYAVPEAGTDAEQIVPPACREERG